MVERVRKKRPGRVQYEPMDEMRRIVELMAGFGITHPEIAAAITPPCNRETLERHFATELEAGASRFKARVAKACMVHLEGRPGTVEVIGEGKKKKTLTVQEEVKPNVTMAIFLAKTKLGLREVQTVEQTVEHNHTHVFDYSKLSDNELHALEATLRKLVTPANAGTGSNPGGNSATKH